MDMRRPSCRSQTAIWVNGLAIIATIAAVLAAEAVPSITRSVVSNGGQGSSNYTPLRVVRSTVGQAVVGRFTAGNRVLGAGFWPGTPTPVIGIADEPAAVP